MATNEIHSRQAPFSWKLLLLLACLYGLAPGDLLAADPVTSDQFLQRVRELRSKHRQTRLQAEQDILSWGDRVLPEFPSAMAVAEAPLKTELIRLQRQLQIQGGERDLRGSRIHFSGTELSRAVRALSVQSGTPVELASPVSPESTQTFRIEWQGILFWDAVDLLCRDHQLRWRWTDAGSIILEPAAADAKEQIPLAATAAINAFRIRAEQAKLFSERDGSAVSPVQRIHLSIDAESAIQPWFVSICDADFHLTQDERPAELFTPDARREIDFSGQRVTFAVNFLTSEDQRPAATRFRGRVQIHYAARNQELRFPIADQSSSIQFAGLQEVKLLSAVRLKEQLRVTMQVLFSADATRDSHRLGHFHRKTWLETKTGEQIAFRTFDLLRASGPVHDIQYEFPVAGIPETELTLIYAMPALAGAVPVPFDLHWVDH